MPGRLNSVSTSAGTSPPCSATMVLAAACSRSARRGWPSLPHARSTSPWEAAARSAGFGQRSIHCRHTGSTLATGVCCSMISLTSTPHGVQSAWRHGRSRALASNQSSSVWGSMDIPGRLTRSWVRGSDYFAKHAGVHLVDEAAYEVGVQQVRIALDPLDRLPHVGVDVAERLDGPRWAHTAGLLQLVLEAVLGDRVQPAVGVLHDQDLPRAEFALAQGE